jgi:endonuclease/exonuclease/phosphatase family metal-dependent hydrolase
MRVWSWWWLGLGLVAPGPLPALTVLTYNVTGNGTTNWSTNSPQVQAIGRQMAHLQPDIITFQEIPLTNTWEMTNFVKAWLPGYALADNSGTDGYIRSVIASRHPIARSQKWLDGVSLVPFGYTNPPATFTRDLFEAEIQVPGWTQPLHVFTTHLKAGTATTDCARRAAEASAVSNFLVTVFLPTRPDRPYVLTGDLNEDVTIPPAASQQPIERLTNPPTGLRLTTPRNPVTGDTRTFNIRTSLFRRYDYILPGGLLFSNIAASQVFRSDRVTPPPPGLLTNDSQVASEHLPVMMEFWNPYDVVFRITTFIVKPQTVELGWQTTPGRRYRVEGATDPGAWSILSTNLLAGSTNLTWTGSRPAGSQFYRVYRLP